MKYSVLLPTRNGGDFLENCIGTILDQPYDDIELIVSDNANTDNTQDILASISDPRLKIIRTEESVSVTENWNRALNASSGDYILMVGDDDCLLPGYFKRMDQILEKYDYPDCVTCNGYSYIDAGSLNGNPENYYKDPFYHFSPEFSEGFLSSEIRFDIVKDMFRFKVRLPLNMQPHLISRRARGYIEGDLFRPPFPDHFALNALLMHAKSWVYVPEKLIVVGVSPKSFGHFVFNNKQEEGKAYLGIDSNFEGQLPGVDLNNCMYIWLNLLKSSYHDKLQRVEIHRPGYVRRQVYSWYQQYKAGIAKSGDLAKWFGTLSLGDWWGLFSSVIDKRSWQKIGSLITSQKKGQVNQVFEGAIPLKQISNIREFADWIADKPTIENQTAK
jgi:glycosyltransferase involved in cell wall biosynthesis